MFGVWLPRGRHMSQSAGGNVSLDRGHGNGRVVMLTEYAHVAVLPPVRESPDVCPPT